VGRLEAGGVQLTSKKGGVGEGVKAKPKMCASAGLGRGFWVRGGAGVQALPGRYAPFKPGLPAPGLFQAFREVLEYFRVCHEPQVKAPLLSVVVGVAVAAVADGAALPLEPLDMVIEGAL